MGTDVIGINRRSIFSLAEARALMPVILRLTKTYSERVQTLIDQVEAANNGGGSMSERVERLEAEAGRLIQEWQTKIQKLGGLPKGLWLVDFDSGDGYFCWKYPEQTVLYWHQYRDGFSKRIRVDAAIDGVFHSEGLNDVAMGDLAHTTV